MPHLRSRREEKAMFANMGSQRAGVSQSEKEVTSMERKIMVAKGEALMKSREEKEIKEIRKKNIPEFVNNKVISEQELNLLKRRLNNGKIQQEDIFGNDFDKTFLLTPEQTKKGLDFLNNQRRTPRGIERKNNPFGAREEDVLDNFDRFEVNEFFDAGNQFVKFNVPLFRVVAKDGSSFEYHFSSGKVNIIG